MKKILLLCAMAFGSAQAEQLSIERIYDSPSLSGKSPQAVALSPDGKRVTFIQGKQDDYERYDLWEYHLESKTTRMLFDSNDLHSGEEVLSDEEKARRERMRVFGSGIMSYQWSQDGQALLFPLGGDAYYFKLGNKKAQKLLDTPEFETDVRLSPKGNYLSYIRNQNLFILDIRSGEENQLTKEGGGAIKFGMAEFVAQEEMGRMTGYWWSPDETHIALTKVDESPVIEITRSEIYADDIKTITQRYPKAGTPNVLIELGVLALSDKQIRWVDMGEEKDMYLARVNWHPGSEMLTYQWQSRNQQTLELRAVNVADLAQNVLITEQSKTWLNLNDDLTFLSNGKQFVWASERDGFKHLYLYNSNGVIERQLTAGNWVVDKVEAIDENAGLLYFSGRKDTPIERHLYRVPLAGGPVTRVSQREGMHSVTFSHDASIYVDTFSTANTPPQVSVHNANGERVTWLEQNEINEQHPLHAYQDSWIAPTFGTINADDGTPLHYRLYTPADISTKRPVIVYLYGGPLVGQMVTNSWGRRGLLVQHWVSKGYVVFTLDNRGSHYRGKAFEDHIYQKMGHVEVEDQVTGVKFLRTLPFVDSERIGVYGHSYGGYMAIMTMFRASDYFQAGVSGAPVTDWRLYDTHYTERYMGNPTEVDEAYTASSVFPYAKNLKGDLLIYHGMADDNVLFTHSTMLYKHLQDNAKLFEVMDYPGKKHSLRGKNTQVHLAHTITRFFDRHLKPE
ncbi:S9 family peptidase [Alteromonas sediminis]|uniref:S9 family peptidase n=1 Tax=Alteromonas sediminis TaxID=2259342 RepID=A0A3N5YQ01_9ALTE|nr:S9 family peptidase [Alteromonas sediminis]RPJ68031.1 S9 family peptidase [Alteromonas sediminis]